RVRTYFGTGQGLHGLVDRHFADLFEHVVEPDWRSGEIADDDHGDHDAVDDDRDLVRDELRHAGAQSALRLRAGRGGDRIHHSRYLLVFQAKEMVLSKALKG